MDQAGIFNTALGRIGSSDTVGAPTDRTVAAQTCLRFYDSCRQEVLRAFPWPFATSSVALAQVADFTLPGWTYAYDTPDDNLRILHITDYAGLRWWSRRFQSGVGGLRYDYAQFAMPRMPWQIALRNDGARQVVVTDVESAYAFYIHDVTNTGAFSPDFSSVLAWRLAMEIAGPLKASREFVDGAEQRYARWAAQAAATAFNESRDDGMTESDSITCRY